MNDETENADVSRLVKTLATRHVASPDLRQSIISAVAAAATPTAQQSRTRWWPEWPWLKLAAAMACGVLISVLLTPLYVHSSHETRLSEEVAAAHVRSLMATHLEDIASTDQHTVKPWFAGRLDFSPPVNDFSVQGFPLSGGRLDYIDRHLTVNGTYLGSHA